jgi:hypothetical protein
MIAETLSGALGKDVRMADKKDILEAKKKELEELRRSRSGATCTYHHSSTDAVSREMRIEDLEDEIAKLEKELAL